jgi:hypothetical protein
MWNILFNHFQQNFPKYLLTYMVSRLGGVMVSVHVTRHVCGFKLCRGDKYLKGIKIHITRSFGGEVKPSIPCRKILSHVKKLLCSISKDTSKAKFIASFAKFLLLCY